MSLLLSIDVGTSSCRGALYDPQLRCLGMTSRELHTRRPHAGWAEQDAKEVLSTVIDVIRETLRYGGEDQPITALTMDTALHTVLGLDRTGIPLTPVLVWEDSRSWEVIRRWRRSSVGPEIYRATGCPLHPMYPPAKIAWWRENEPELFKKVDKFVSLKSFLLLRLTGQLLEDQAIASGSGLLNIHTLDWDDGALSLAGISRDRLAPLVRPSHVIEEIARKAASITGLSSSTAVVVGSSDAAMSSLGSGSLYTDQMTVMIGTSGAVRRLVNRPAFDPQQRTFCYYLGDGLWYAGGAINNGGLVFRWFRDTLGHDAVEKARQRGLSPYDVMTEYAAHTPPGADGLLFLPFLAGERSPFWTGNMRGALLGLSVHHGQGHIIRALMEGICYRIFSIFKPLEDLLGPPKEVRATGGFTRSSLWLKILSDVLGQELLVLEEAEGSVLGSAALAYLSLGMLDTFEAVGEKNPVSTIVRPDPNRHEFYMEQFDRYMRWYWRLREEWDPPQGCDPD